MKKNAFLEDALGTSSRDLGPAYTLLLQLGIHDVNLLRFLFGELEAIDSAHLWRPGGDGPVGVSADLRLGDGVPCRLDVAPLFGAPWPWMEEIEVVYPDEVVRLRLGNPFLPMAASHVDRVGEHEAGHGSLALQDGLADPFVLQIEAALTDVSTGSDACCGVADAIADLVVVESIMRALATS